MIDKNIFIFIILLMEGLFFALDPIWFSGNIPQFNGVLFLIGLFFIVVYPIYKGGKSRLSIDKKGNIALGITDLSDPRFIEKTIQEIRKYIAMTRNPEHTWAHVPKEISCYLNDGSIIATLEKLENIQYSGTKPSKEDLTQIQNELIKKTL